MLLCLLPRLSPKLADKQNFLFSIALAWTVLVAVSRIVMGAHYSPWLHHAGPMGHGSLHKLFFNPEEQNPTPGFLSGLAGGNLDLRRPCLPSSAIDAWTLLTGRFLEIWIKQKNLKRRNPWPYGPGISSLLRASEK